MFLNTAAMFFNETVLVSPSSSPSTDWLWLSTSRKSWRADLEMYSLLFSVIALMASESHRVLVSNLSMVTETPSALDGQQMLTQQSGGRLEPLLCFSEDSWTFWTRLSVPITRTLSSRSSDGGSWVWVGITAKWLWPEHEAGLLLRRNSCNVCLSSGTFRVLILFDIFTLNVFVFFLKTSFACLFSSSRLCEPKCVWILFKGRLYRRNRVYKMMRSSLKSPDASAETEKNDFCLDEAETCRFRPGENGSSMSTAPMTGSKNSFHWFIQTEVMKSYMNSNSVKSVYTFYILKKHITRSN